MKFLLGSAFGWAIFVMLSNLLIKCRDGASGIFAMTPWAFWGAAILIALAFAFGAAERLLLAFRQRQDS